MTTTTTQPQAQRFLARVLAVLAALAVLVGLMSMAPSASATEDGYTWRPVRDVASFVYWARANGAQVLHVDTEHMTDDGFWYATKGGGVSGYRDMLWVYQPWGMRCRDDTYRLGFNPWLNTYACIRDMDRADAASPTMPTTPRPPVYCRESQGRPWAYGAQVRRLRRPTAPTASSTPPARG